MTWVTSERNIPPIPLIFADIRVSASICAICGRNIQVELRNLLFGRERIAGDISLFYPK